MGFSVGRLGERVTIRVERQLIGDDGEKLKAAVGEQLARDAKIFIVDFTVAIYFDSQSLGGLVFAAKQIRLHGGQMQLVNLNCDLRQLFELTHLDEYFDFGPSGPHIA